MWSFDPLYPAAEVGLYTLSGLNLLTHFIDIRHNGDSGQSEFNDSDSWKFGLSGIPSSKLSFLMSVGVNFDAYQWHHLLQPVLWDLQPLRPILEQKMHGWEEREGGVGGWQNYQL
jgi:hypothetical protein